MADYKTISGGSLDLYKYDSWGRKKPKGILEHRFVWIKNRGAILPGYIIHHINGNKKDNRIENLEAITPSEHRKKHPKKNEN